MMDQSIVAREGAEAGLPVQNSCQVQNKVSHKW